MESRSREADIVAVGAGPQLLRALADLELALETNQDPQDACRRRPVRVVAVDPHEPGAGAVWRVDQPACLRMNVSARLVDVRSPSVPWDLQQWHMHEHGAMIARYPSRALVGQYLRWVWLRLRSSPLLELTHLRGTVVSVGRGPGGWSCEIEDRDCATAGVVVAPRVVLCTGHRDAAPFDHARLAAGDESTAAGRTVVVQGAALTAFDAVMCLTEGRGGAWEARTSPGSVPRYRPSGREPDRIVLLSRSGRVMLPKPTETSPAMLTAVTSLRLHWGRADPLGDRWWNTLVEAARRAAAAHDVDLDDDLARSWLDAPPAAAGSVDVARRWRADLRRAAGEHDDDPAWWLGRAWAAAYPDLLASIERTSRDPQTWPTFRRRAATLERWAFGPPAELVARLVALIDQGRLAVADSTAAGPPGIVAHIAPPGVLPEPRRWADEGGTPAESSRPADHSVLQSRLWTGLLADGAVTVRRGESGVLTTLDGTCVRADGGTSAGLSALGRPTEGPVVDHDSLQRYLHLDAKRWAMATARALSGGPRPASGHREEASTS